MRRKADGLFYADRPGSGTTAREWPLRGRRGARLTPTATASTRERERVKLRSDGRVSSGASVWNDGPNLLATGTEAEGFESLWRGSEPGRGRVVPGDSSSAVVTA